MHSILAQPIPDQPCRLCRHYGGVAWGDASCAWCLRDGRRCTAQPERGCAFFERAAEGDDGWAEERFTPSWSA